jgi:hypothetical protein
LLIVVVLCSIVDFLKFLFDVSPKQQREKKRKERKREATRERGGETVRKRSTKKKERDKRRNKGEKQTRTSLLFCTSACLSTSSFSRLNK